MFKNLKKFILSKASIVYILSDEEDAVEDLLKELTSTFQPDPKLFIWNPFYGLTERTKGLKIRRILWLWIKSEYRTSFLSLFLRDSTLFKDRPSKEVKGSPPFSPKSIRYPFIVAPCWLSPWNMVVYEFPMPTQMRWRPDGNHLHKSPGFQINRIPRRRS